MYKMVKLLKISFPEKCIGCELCILEVQRQLNKVGLDGSPIRIFRNKEERILLGEVTYTIELDPSVGNLKLEGIKKACPTGVFTIEDVEKPEDSLLE
jgi:ferredoxin